MDPSSPSMFSSTPSIIQSEDSSDIGAIVQERDALRAQNQQLWALVEKQRVIIAKFKAARSSPNSSVSNYSLADADSPTVENSPVVGAVGVTLPPQFPQRQFPSLPKPPEYSPARSLTTSPSSVITDDGSSNRNRSQSFGANTAGKDGPQVQEPSPLRRLSSPPMNVPHRLNTQPEQPVDTYTGTPVSPSKEMPEKPDSTASAQRSSKHGSIYLLDDPSLSYLAYFDESSTVLTDKEPVKDLPQLSPGQIEALKAKISPPPQHPPPPPPAAVEKPFKLGRLRPSSVVENVRPTARVKFSADTYIYDQYSDEEAHAEYVDVTDLGYTWTEEDDDGEFHNGDPKRSSNSSFTSMGSPGNNVSPPSFPLRSQESMSSPLTRTVSHSSPEKPAPVEKNVAPPRNESSSRARDSIFVRKSKGSKFHQNHTVPQAPPHAGSVPMRPPVPQVPPPTIPNRTQSAQQPPPAIPARMQSAQAPPPQQFANRAPPSSMPPKRTISSPSNSNVRNSAMSSPSPRNSTSPLGGGEPPYSSPSPSFLRSQVSDRLSNPDVNAEIQPGSDLVIDDLLVHRLLTGDRSNLQQKLNSMTPAQMAQLQAMLKSRVNNNANNHVHHNDNTNANTDPSPVHSFQESSALSSSVSSSLIPGSFMGPNMY